MACDRHVGLRRRLRATDARVLRPTDPAARRGGHRRRQAVRPGEAQR